MDDKITFSIEIHEPIDIDAFCKSLYAIQDEFTSITNNSSKLLIKEIRKGSIEIDLISVAIAAATILPILENANTVFQFMEYIRKTIAWLLGKRMEPEEIKYSIKELQNLKELFQPIAIASNTDSKIKISADNQEDIIVEKEQAVVITEAIIYKEKRFTVPSQYFAKDLKQCKVLFNWYQTRFDSERINTGNQGVVEIIDKNPKKVIFADDASETKHQMTTTNPALKRDWQEIGYIVDLELIVSGEKVIGYKILKNYPEDSIIP